MAAILVSNCGSWVSLQRVTRAKVVGGFFLYPDEPRGGQTVFGAGVARRAILDAVMRHGKAERYALFASPYELEKARKRVQAWHGLRRGRPAQIDVHPVWSLLEGVDPFGLDHWFSSELDVERAFHVRQWFARRAYPITLTHHTLSYQWSLHHQLLRLLLEDVRPYDSVICTSTASRTALRHLLDYISEQFARSYGAKLSYRGRLDVVPLGVDTDRFRPRPQRELREQLELPLDAVIVLYAGRLSATDKGDLVPLLRAFRDVVAAPKKLRRPALLVLAGTNRRKDSVLLREQATQLGVGSQVHVLEELEPAHRHLLFGAADVFVAPADNIQETFGLTPLEAMASGVPVIAADWDGYRDTVLHGHTGFLIPTLWGKCDEDLAAGAAVLGLPDFLDHLALAQATVLDPGSLRRHLDLLVRSEELRRRLGAEARKHVMRTLSWKRVVAACETLWAGLGREAHGQTITPPPGSYTVPPFFEAFAGYATRTLPENPRLRITREGRAVAAGKAALPAHYVDAGVLDPKLAQAILSALARARRGAPLEQVIRAARPKARFGPARARRHVLWTLKYGLVELDES